MSVQCSHNALLKVAKMNSFIATSQHSGLIVNYNGIINKHNYDIQKFYFDFGE